MSFRYSAGFKALAEAIAGFPTLSQHSQFIFIPGPTDPWSSSTLPRPPIPDSFVEPIRAKVPKATFTSNPARLKYFDQEIVIFREDLMGRMLRNIVQIKDGTEGANMKRYVGVQAVFQCQHLLIFRWAFSSLYKPFSTRRTSRRYLYK
jgi:DNA polymerase epsilon subunit 2